MSDFWTFTDYFKAQEPGNEAMKAMIDCYMTGSKVMETEPDVAIAYFKEGRAKAEALDMHWWVLLFDHWTIQTLLFFKRDYNTALDISAKATVDARKPHLADCPTRVCVHEDLISVYLGRDPIGMADEIKGALDYMAREITSKSSCYFCLKGRRINFEMAHDNLDTAFDEAMDFFSITENSKHYHIHAIGDLLEIAFILEDWPEMLRLAKLGEPLAIEKDRREWVAIFKAWQVLALYQTGDPTHEQVLLNLQAYTKTMRPVTSTNYFDAMCAYYEAQGNATKALELRNELLESMTGNGQYWYEYKARLKQLRLLQKLGQDTNAAVATLREVANRFAKPDKFLAEIDAALAVE